MLNEAVFNKFSKPFDIILLQMLKLNENDEFAIIAIMNSINKILNGFKIFYNLYLKINYC